MLVAMMAMTSQAAITVYVQAEEAPYIWAWGGSGNIFSVAWPGPQLTEKKTVTNTTTGEPTEFWYYTFDESITLVNILFNNGGEGPTHLDVKQTKDINGITTDRYFTYDGASGWTDITEQFGGEIPDAEVQSLILVGNHNEWSGENPYTFDVIESGKTFKGTITIDLTGMEITDNLWQFKIRPNAQGWVGYYENVTINAPEWCYESMADGNFEVDLEADAVVANGPKFKIDAEWAGGKDYEWGWTVSVALATGDTPKVRGDVNGDGAVDVADISSIITIMAESTNDLKGDVNGDGMVDVADISNVITIMAGGE